MRALALLFLLAGCNTDALGGGSTDLAGADLSISGGLQATVETCHAPFRRAIR